MSNVAKIRSLIRLAPELAQASFVTQVIQLNRVIAGTFEFSEGMKEQLRNIPPHYIERVQEAYQKKMFDAFDRGYEGCKGLPIDFSNFDVEIQTKCGCPIEICNELKTDFEEDVGEYLKTVVNLEQIYAQFSLDLDCAYKAGACEALKEAHQEFQKSDKPMIEETHVEETQVISATATPVMEPKLSEQQVRKELLDYVNNLKDPEAKKVMKYYLGLGEQVTAAISKDEIVKKMESYVSLMKDQEGQKVLRYFLGLGEKTAIQASVEETETPAPVDEVSVPSGPADLLMSTTKVGPYDMEALKQKILNLQTSFQMEEDSDDQCLVVDCLVANLQEKGFQEASKEICQKLELSDLIGVECSFEDVEMAASEMAAEMTIDLGLPGDLCFMDYDNNYCLVYVFAKDQLAQEKSSTVISAKAKSTSGLPGGPQGALEHSLQKELNELISIGVKTSTMLTRSPRLMKDIKKAAPHLANHIGELFTMMRNSKISLKDGMEKLNKDAMDLIEDAYGRDAAQYFAHQTQKPAQV